MAAIEAPNKEEDKPVSAVQLEKAKERMSEGTFKFMPGLEVREKASGLKGTIPTRCQLINGCVQYGVQPKCKEDANYLSDGYSIDEDSIELVDASAELTTFTHTFRYETGDRVRNRINGAQGIIVRRTLYANG